MIPFKKILLLLLLIAVTGRAQLVPNGANGLPEVAYSDLSDKSITPLGMSALAIRKNEWKHAETPNFVYHFFQHHVAAAVSVEAEYYYRFIAKDLDRETASWQRKCHVFIFEKPEDWRAFQAAGHLDPWTGGIHARGELFIVRNPAFKWKGHSLAHEIAHLVIDRFFGSGVPLWVNEGYAEYAGMRAYVTYFRLRGYNGRPTSRGIAPEDYITIANLTGLLAYPADVKQVGTFYDESERLVRFLSSDDKTQFVAFLDALGKGSRFDSAIGKAFGNRFPSLEGMEREFKFYASKNYETAQN